VDEGWRIISVWDSPEHLQRFREVNRATVLATG
jgi:hypothetical protein